MRNGVESEIRNVSEATKRRKGMSGKSLNRYRASSAMLSWGKVEYPTWGGVVELGTTSRHRKIGYHDGSNGKGGHHAISSSVVARRRRMSC